ncbi:MAG: CoA transferase [Gammaproteobacteria bacterium]|nr:CoA transferase [Gammaproteobacteria bacterium]
MGPLQGIKIIELAGIGPCPFAAMMLADAGAEIIRVDRTNQVMGGDPETPPMALNNRSRKSIGVNLKSPDGVETVLKLVEQADGIMEGFRPGVMERLGLGPDVCLARNPKLVFGRMTGFGQKGPAASMAGHDINYIALSSALHHIGPAGQKPVVPLNLAGDYGGGGMFLAYGMLAALISVGKTGKGQVVDAAMTDGSAVLMTMFYGLNATGSWGERGSNFIDGGSHFYDTYKTRDGKYVSLGSIEPQFYAQMLELTGLGAQAELPEQNDRSRWPEMKARLAAIIESKTRDEWSAILDGSDVCFAPVLSMDEAPHHSHNIAQATFTEVAGVTQPAPAPKFSVTPSEVQMPPPHPGQHTDEALSDWGFSADDIARLKDVGAVK